MVGNLLKIEAQRLGSQVFILRLLDLCSLHSKMGFGHNSEGLTPSGWGSYRWSDASAIRAGPEGYRSLWQSGRRG